MVLGGGMDIWGREDMGVLPSGELTFCHGKWPFIVDFPMKKW